MCIVSDKLKLCACETKDVTKLKHYWTLTRPTGGKDHILGFCALPSNEIFDTDKYNYPLLKKLLNSGECLDVDIMPADNDILELYFTVGPIPREKRITPWNKDYIVYTFKYRSGKWQKEEHDPFGTNVKDIQAGKIKNAFT